MPSSISRHPPRPNLTLAFGLPHHPSTAFPGRSQSPHRALGEGAEWGERPRLREEAGQVTWSLTLDPAAPLFLEEAASHSGGPGRSLSFPRGGECPPGVRSGLRMESPETAKPPRRPRRLSGPPGPGAGISYLHTFLRHGGGGGGAGSARGRTARSEPPYLGAPRVQQPRRAGGGASGRLRPSSSAPSFAFDCWG